MSNRRKPTGPSRLFPVKDEFPETRKMSEKFDANMDIYQFMDHMIAAGYVISRRDTTGALKEMRPESVVEHELLAYRGVNKLAYYTERTKMRNMYPHIVAKYGGDKLIAEVPTPEFVEGEQAPAPKMAVQADGLDFLLRKIRGEDDAD